MTLNQVSKYDRITHQMVEALIKAKDAMTVTEVIYREREAQRLDWNRKSLTVADGGPVPDPSHD